jgi:hypothetical protein
MTGNRFTIRGYYLIKPGAALPLVAQPQALDRKRPLAWSNEDLVRLSKTVVRFGDQLKATLDSLRTATEAALQSTLGPEAWPEYASNIGFNSLNAISPRN